MPVKWTPDVQDIAKTLNGTISIQSSHVALKFDLRPHRAAYNLAALRFRVIVSDLVTLWIKSSVPYLRISFVTEFIYPNTIQQNVGLWNHEWLDRLTALRWRHNGRDSISNHQPHDCFLNRLFRRRSKKTSKLRVTGLCAGNSPVPGEFPRKWPVTRKMFPFDDGIMV